MSGSWKRAPKKLVHPFREVVECTIDCIYPVWAGLPCNMCLWCVAAEPRHNVYPAVVGAAIGGMLFAAIVTVLLLVFIIRNRHNNPRKSEQASIGFINDLALILCVSSTRATWYAVWFVSICVAPATIRIYSLYWCSWCSLWSYTPRKLFSPFCCIQAAQPVKGKHQLSRGWDCRCIRGTYRGQWRRQDNPSPNIFIFIHV